MGRLHTKRGSKGNTVMESGRSNRWTFRRGLCWFECWSDDNVTGRS
jgi:hypothetical protein